MTNFLRSDKRWVYQASQSVRFIFKAITLMGLTSLTGLSVNAAEPSSPPLVIPGPQSAPPPPPQQLTPADQLQQLLQSSNYAQNNSVNVVPANPEPPPVSQRRVSQPVTYEEGQQIMLDSAPPSSRPVTQEEMMAFNEMMRQNMPLSPQQVVQLRQQIDMSQRAASIHPNIPPKPVSTTLMVNLAPGTTPPAVRLAQGYVSSLVFVDSTGSPWPIAAFDIGNPKALNIQWDGKSNIILLQAVSPYMDGNMVVRLVGLPTPITLQLVAGQRVVDYRVDLHVSGIGPNSKDVPMGTTLPNSADQLLLGVLDGVSPAGSKILHVRGADAQAWLLGDRIFLRTRLTLLSPGWIGTMSSSDGMHAYELQKTSSVLVSRYGEPAELKIEGL